ncbi:hypothetical protein BEWA_020740 [Theileria equi strain WA]|uniref:Uncharacterized protein n=1 Tax=Theileria equi strain WA TaxID=1537102 RepID=L0AUB1_THEEQ|nr:hypothetical protein BEWA_020740 [Theileria equi strain WA]AFZ79227.1 hypothetical protein BEWA_020740 [Theileria equi strain WA]|eukprot:XP_004828893.1 hypothetical protein BEWA_020740 [Theileria equi strain WA]
MVDDGVTIRLGVKQPNSVYTTGGRTIKVTRDEEPPGSGFTRYTHKDEHNQPFILAKIQDNQNYPIDINQLGGKEVTSVAAYYWTGNASNVLMVGVTTGNTTTYYGNRKSDGSNEWIELTGYKHSHPPLINDDIERTLDDLVCSSYGAVTMDLSKGTFTSGNRQPYCCRCIYHAGNDDQRKISLSEGSFSCTHKRAGYYKQSPTANTKLAAIRYYFDGVGTANTNNPSRRRRIKIPKLNFPTSDVEAVYAVHCSNNPVLIYVKYTGGGKATGWYKKPATDENGNEKWEKVLDEVPDPESITGCDKYNQLVKALNDTGRCGIPLCPPPLNPPPPQQQLPPVYGPLHTKSVTPLSKDTSETKGSGDGTNGQWIQVQALGKGSLFYSDGKGNQAAILSATPPLPGPKGHPGKAGASVKANGESGGGGLSLVQENSGDSPALKTPKVVVGNQPDGSVSPGETEVVFNTGVKTTKSINKSYTSSHHWNSFKSEFERLSGSINGKTQSAGRTNSSSHRTQTVADLSTGAQPREPTTPITSTTTTEKPAPKAPTSDGKSSIVTKVASGGASALGTGGAAYGGWYVWVNYFLDPLVRLI